METLLNCVLFVYRDLDPYPSLGVRSTARVRAILRYLQAPNHTSEDYLTILLPCGGEMYLRVASAFHPVPQRCGKAPFPGSKSLTILPSSRSDLCPEKNARGMFHTDHLLGLGDCQTRVCRRTLQVEASHVELLELRGGRRYEGHPVPSATQSQKIS